MRELFGLKAFTASDMILTKERNTAMFQEDWYMKQIRYAIQFISRMLFDADYISYEIRGIYSQTETDMLYTRLNSMVDEGHINEAENLLFEALDTGDTNHLILAVDFYSRLNDKSDEELEANAFSREEVENGLNDIKTQFGISL
jgi:hypothetical protein